MKKNEVVYQEELADDFLPVDPNEGKKKFWAWFIASEVDGLTFGMLAIFLALCIGIAIHDHSVVEPIRIFAVILIAAILIVTSRYIQYKRGK